MPSDPLQSTLSHIEAICQSNDMALFYGHVVDDFGYHILWDGEEQEMRPDEFLARAKQADIKLLHVERVYNDMEIDEETLQDLLSYGDDEDDEEGKKGILADAAVVRGTKGQLVSLTLSFFYQGGCYSWEQKAAWEPAYTRMENVLYGSNPDDDDVYDDEDEDDDSGEKERTDEQLATETKDQGTAVTSHGTGAPSSLLSILGSRDALPAEVIEQHARKLIQAEKYIAAKYKNERKSIAKQLLKAEGFTSMREWWVIKDRAEQLYQDEIVPLREREYVERIKAYLKSTNKPSMAGAARKLGMDSRRVGPYWEKAKSS